MQPTSIRFGLLVTAFAHGLVAATLHTLVGPKHQSTLLLALGIFCAVLPDLDVVFFRFGIPYGHWLGHRGFMHSLFFAALIAGGLRLAFFRREPLLTWRSLGIAVFLFTCMASHGLLDALTSGGKGIAFFAPFDNERYFLPYRPILVSPIGIGNFFSEWGLRVILSELRWVGLPCLLLLIGNWAGRLGKHSAR